MTVSQAKAHFKKKQVSDDFVPSCSGPRFASAPARLSYPVKKSKLTADELEDMYCKV